MEHPCEAISPEGYSCKLEKPHVYHLSDTQKNPKNYPSTWVKIWKDEPFLPGITHSQY